MVERPENDSERPAKEPSDQTTPDKTSKNWIEGLAKRSTGLPGDVKSSAASGPESKEKSPWSYAGLGIQFAGTVCLFMYAGYKLDEWQGWSSHVGLITLSLLAVVGNMYLLIKESIKQDKS